MNNIHIYAFSDEASPMIDEQIIALQSNGLDGMEIRNVDQVNVSDISDAKAKEVRKKMDDAGLSVWSIGSPIGKTDIDDPFAAPVEKFRRTLEIASILGSKNIRLFSFFIPDGKNPNSYKEQVIDRLGTFLDIARGSGITLCHENEKGIYGDLPERCLELHRALPDLAGIFDPANFIQCGADTQKAWAMLKDHIKYLHIKDAFADGSIVPAGMGEGHLNAIVKDYCAAGGSHFTIEPHLTVFDGLAQLEKEGNTTHIVPKYPDSKTAFQAACRAFQTIIKENVL